MAFYSTMTSETQAKKTYYNLLNDETNPSKFTRELQDMANKTVYFLMYSGVPEYIIPLVIQKASLVNPKTIQKDLFKRVKTNKYCIICGENRARDLTLHHVKPVKDYPEFKYRYDNLRVLCKSCHDNLHYWE